ncbi:MAG: hypothetical protein MZW92_76935 [Comamonadaceae bacterium]|nr:hypothetical protein [Comamonadaceae bacterium]
MKRWDIGSRVLFAAVVPAMLTAVVLAWYFTYARIAALDRELHEHGYAIARRLAPASEYGVFSGQSRVPARGCAESAVRARRRRRRGRVRQCRSAHGQQRPAVRGGAARCATCGQAGNARQPGRTRWCSLRRWAPSRAGEIRTRYGVGGDGDGHNEIAGFGAGADVAGAAAGAQERAHIRRCGDYDAGLAGCDLAGAQAEPGRRAPGPATGEHRGRDQGRQPESTFRHRSRRCAQAAGIRHQ